MVPGQQHIQDAGVALAEGKADPGEMGLHQMLSLIHIYKITEATAEQSQAVSQVTQGMDQISSVVQTNSATAEESAAASEELSGQAVILKELVGQFKTR